MRIPQANECIMFRHFLWRFQQDSNLTTELEKTPFPLCSFDCRLGNIFGTVIQHFLNRNEVQPGRVKGMTTLSFFHCFILAGHTQLEVR